MSTYVEGQPFVAPSMNMAKAGKTFMIAASIAGKVAYEKVVRPKAVRLSDVPYDLSAVTEPWLKFRSMKWSCDIESSW